MTTNEMITYDQMVEMGIATAEELNLARNLVAGTWEDVLNAVMYVRTGYRTFEQWMEAEMEEEWFLKSLLTKITKYDNITIERS